MLRVFTTHVYTCLASNQVDLPKVELKFFFERKARAINFVCFWWRGEREALYQNRKREAKD